MQELAIISADLEGRYLTFVLGDGGFGVPIIKVQEIIGVNAITRVPRSRSFLKGIMNIRGKVIPVIDLRLLLGLEERAYDDRTCLIVVHSMVGGDPISSGLIVDQVNEVLDFSSSDLTFTTAESFNGANSHYVRGFGRHERGVSMLLDIDSMLSTIVESRKVGFRE